MLESFTSQFSQLSQRFSAFRPTQIFVILGWTLGCVMLLASGASAVTYGSLSITAENPISGESSRGYTEFRIYVRNNHPTETYKVGLELGNSSFGRVPDTFVHKELNIGPNSDSTVSVAVPGVGLRSSYLRIRVNGLLLKESIPMPLYMSGGHWRRNDELLWLVDRSVSRKDFGEVFESAGYGHTRNTMVQADTALSAWSSNWLAYTRFAGIVLNADEFQTTQEAVRRAILRYVEIGGALVLLGPYQPEAPWTTLSYHVSEIEVQSARVGFGIIIYSHTSDFSTLFSACGDSIQADGYENTQALRVNRNATSMHHSVPISAQSGVSARQLLVLVGFFALLIGPINLYWLHRRGRRIWVFWTVPLISMVACASVFLYASLSEGWSLTMRCESVTLLNETQGLASTIGWIGLYSPLTVDNGLRFSFETEVSVVPEARYSRDFSGREIDLTNEQHFSSGWIRARVPTYFTLRKSEMRPERLLLEQDEATGQPKSVTNMLGRRIRSLHLLAGDERILQAKSIQPGQKVKLVEYGKITAQSRKTMLEEIFRRDWVSMLNKITHDPDKEPDLADFSPSMICWRAGMYIAVLDSSPFLEKFVDDVGERRDKAVVIGFLKGF